MHECSASRRDAMAFTAASAPAALLLGGKGIVWALPGIALAALLYAVTAKRLEDGAELAARLPRAILIAELVFLVAAMAKAASLASLCWSTGGTFPLFSLALLGLAAAGASFGAEAATRGAVVLTWACGIFFSVLLGTTAAKTQVPQAVGAPADAAAVCAVMLSAMCALFLPARGKGRTAQLWGALAPLTLFILYVSWDKQGQVPLLTAVKGAELFGTFQRYEALASCAMTVGLYQLLVLLGSAGAAIVKRMFKIPIAWFYLGAAAIMFVIDSVPATFWIGGAAIFWGAIPLLATRSWAAKKDAKNGEKSA